jgi:hypothetical protein
MTGMIAEIVTFTLLPGADPARFVADSAAVDALLAQTPGFVDRRLARGADGTWVDYVVWSDMACAEAAAATLPARPEAGPFMQAIDPAGLSLRHAEIAAAAP